jgi:hypothetical protein
MSGFRSEVVMMRVVADRLLKNLRVLRPFEGPQGRPPRQPLVPRLSRGQHERKMLDHFNRRTVCPEVLEG